MVLWALLPRGRPCLDGRVGEGSPLLKIPQSQPRWFECWELTSGHRRETKPTNTLLSVLGNRGGQAQVRQRKRGCHGADSVRSDHVTPHPWSEILIRATDKSPGRLREIYMYHHGVWLQLTKNKYSGDAASHSMWEDTCGRWLFNN